MTPQTRRGSTSPNCALDDLPYIDNFAELADFKEKGRSCPIGTPFCDVLVRLMVFSFPKTAPAHPLHSEEEVGRPFAQKLILAPVVFMWDSLPPAMPCLRRVYPPKAALRPNAEQFLCHAGTRIAYRAATHIIICARAEPDGPTVGM